MDDLSLLDALQAQGDLLVAATRNADPDRAAPGLDWTVREVVLHTGSVHRWAADIVGRALATNETGGSVAFAPDPAPADADLPRWLAEGVAALVRTLRDAPAGLDCFRFIATVPSRRFWIRRQLHETAIHRVDLEAAAGPVSPVPADVAQDGLGELVGAFALEPWCATDRAGRLRFECTDGPSWRVTFGGQQNIVDTGPAADGPADAVVLGTSDELYRWAWNRPVDLIVEGDADVVECWRRIRIT